MLSVVQWFGFGNIRQLAVSLSAQTGGFGQIQTERSPGASALAQLWFQADSCRQASFAGKLAA